MWYVFVVKVYSLSKFTFSVLEPQKSTFETGVPLFPTEFCVFSVVSSYNPNSLRQVVFC